MGTITHRAPLAAAALVGALGGALAVLLGPPAALLLAGGRDRDLAPPPLAIPKVEFAPALATLGDGSAVYTDGTGRLFHLRSGPAGLSLSAVYALRRDLGRFETEPERRAAHGYYIDDLAPESAQSLARALERYTREARSGAVDAQAFARMEREARTILSWGDATFLLGRLEDRSYGARRAAALVLGSAGYAEARKTLLEISTETSGDGAERARAALSNLPPAPESGK